MRYVQRLRFGLVAGLLALAPAQLPAQGNSITVPYVDVVFNPCTETFVSLSGRLHIVTYVTVDANGGFHAKIQFQTQGVKGVDLITGDAYVGSGVTQEMANLTSGALESTFVNRTSLIGQGNTPNAVLVQNVHLTLNSNGLTANVSNLRLMCH